MAKEFLGLPLLERYRALNMKARAARAGLSLSTTEAEDAVYQLRLCLRICRILKRFVRKSPDYIVASAVLDHCYRATGRVRDQQVGLELIQQLEQGWPRNRRRPSTALRASLRHDYAALAREVDALGLEQALQGLDKAFSALTLRVPEVKLHSRAQKHAQKLETRMLHRLHQAMADSTEDAWHDLRLSIKRYRFWVTSLSDWLPEALLQDARQLKPMQVSLGHFHDWVVLEQRLPSLDSVPLALWLPEVARRKQEALAEAQEQLAPLQARVAVFACD